MRRLSSGEGTLWDPGAKVLRWVDIWGKAIRRYDPATGTDDVFEPSEYVGCVGVRAAIG
jgi:sugar lactone lactonase YvrE